MAATQDASPDAGKDAFPQYGDYAGRVVITWPKAVGSRSVLSNLTTIEDADTGEQLTGVIGIRLIVGSEDGFTPGILTVELAEVIAENGKAGRGSGWQPAPTPEYVEHCRQMKTIRGERSILDLTDAEVDELDAMRRAFTATRFQTSRREYLVAEMRVAD